MRALLAVLVVLLATPVAAADVDLCRDADAELATIECETTPYPNNEVHRSTQLELDTDPFVLRVRFEEQDAGNATAPRCSVYYHRHGGTPGPQSIEWGTALCFYPFYWETP